MRTPISLMIGAAAVLTPLATSAQTMGSLPTASTGAIEVAGMQPVMCGASFDEASASVNLVATTSRSVGITLSCNSRFRLLARSETGVLRNRDSYSAGNALTYVPYTIAWPATLIDESGAAIAPSFTAPGTAWAARLSATSAPVRQVQHGAMVIAWQPATAVLAGSYTDTFYLDIIAN